MSASRIIICSHCGHNNDSSRLRCSACGRVLPRSGASAASSTPLPPTTASTPPAHKPIPAPARTPVPTPASASARGRGTPDLAGVVLSVSHTQMRKSGDWTGTTLKGLLALIALPFRPLMVLTALLFGQRSTPEFQEVTVLRVEDIAGRPVQARIEAEIRGAVVELGDEVELWGHYRNGVLIVSRGYNSSTNAEIRLHKGIDLGKGFQILAIIVIVFLLIGLCSLLTSYRPLTPFAR